MPGTGINVTSESGENSSKKSKVLGYFLPYSILFVNNVRFMKLIHIYKQFLARRKEFGICTLVQFPNFFPLLIMKTVMPSQYFSRNKPMATEMHGGRIKNRANIE
jgi:hypothetical protein